MSSSNLVRWLFLVFAAATLIGCTGGNRRAVKPVTVTIRYKGSPVADATVTFISEEGDPTSAFGKTDAQGIAKPTTPQVGDGVTLGKHKIIVTKEQIVSDKSVAPGGESSDYAPPDAKAPKVKDLIPAKYKAPGSSPLTAEVTSGGPNDFKFDLNE